MNSKVSSGFGVLVDGEIAWSEIGNDKLCLAIIVRDRDFPNGDVIKWAQAKTGSATVYEIINTGR